MSSDISSNPSHVAPVAFANTNSIVPPHAPMQMVTAVRRVGMRLKKMHQYIMLLACAMPNKPHAIADTQMGIHSNDALNIVLTTATSASSDPTVKSLLRCSNIQSCLTMKKANDAASVRMETMRSITPSWMSQKSSSTSEGLKTAESSHPIRQEKPMPARMYVFRRSPGVLVRFGSADSSVSPMKRPSQHLSMIRIYQKNRFQH